MRVPHDEGLAIHVDPKPCIGAREGDGEASAGECVGQPLSRESDITRDADAVTYAEGNTDGCAIASIRPIPRGLRPWHAQTLRAREPGDLQSDRSIQRGGPHREGEEPEPMMHGPEKSDLSIVAKYPFSVFKCTRGASQSAWQG